MFNNDHGRGNPTEALETWSVSDVHRTIRGGQKALLGTPCWADYTRGKRGGSQLTSTHFTFPSFPIAILKGDSETGSGRCQSSDDYRRLLCPKSRQGEDQWINDYRKIEVSPERSVGHEAHASRPCVGISDKEKKEDKKGGSSKNKEIGESRWVIIIRTRVIF